MYIWFPHNIPNFFHFPRITRFCTKGVLILKPQIQKLLARSLNLNNNYTIGAEFSRRNNNSHLTSTHPFIYSSKSRKISQLSTKNTKTNEFLPKIPNSRIYHFFILSERACPERSRMGRANSLIFLS